MAKKPTVTTITSGYASNTQLNANFTALRNSFDNTLSLDGSTPNAMGADLDLNNNDILNVNALEVVSLRSNGQDLDLSGLNTLAPISAEIVTLAQLQDGTVLLYGLSDLHAVKDDIAALGPSASSIPVVAGIDTEVVTVAGIAADVTTVAANVTGVTSFAEKYRVGASDPSTSLDEGDLFYNTTSNQLKVYNGATWDIGVTPGSGFLVATNNLSDVANASVARANLGLNDYVTLTGSEVLTNKTIIDPVVTLNATQGTTGQVLLSQGSGLPPIWGEGSPITADEVTAMKANILLNSFRIAVAGSFSVSKMVDGISDEYEDETGVDTSNSLGFKYDSTLDAYDFGPTYSDPYSTGNRTSLITVTTDLAVTVGPLSRLVDGSTANLVQFTYDSNIAGNWVKFDFGSGVTKILGGVKLYAYEATTRGFWKWQGSNNNTTWTDISSSVQLVNGITTWTITDQTAYRYVRVLGVSGGLDAACGLPCGWGQVEFKLTSPTTPALLVSDDFSANSTPLSALLVLWQENLVSTTLNTDLTAWVSREDGKVFTTNFSSSNTALLSTAHGYENGDRLMVSSSSQDLPLGLLGGVVYYVVNSATDSLELSLTSGGSAVQFSDNGTGTHNIRQWSQVTLSEEVSLTSDGRILVGNCDFNGHPTGAAVRYAVVMPNGKFTRLHGAAVQWR